MPLQDHAVSPTLAISTAQTMVCVEVYKCSFRKEHLVAKLLVRERQSVDILGRRERQSVSILDRRERQSVVILPN